MKSGSSKRKLEDIMKEYNGLLVQGITVFNDAINVLCDNKHKEYDEKVKEIIDIERKSDRLKEELTEKFIRRETMAFSRGDRIHLIEEIDITLDNIEYCARTIQTHKNIIEDYSPVATHFKRFAKDLTEMIKTLSSAIDIAENDLLKTIEGTKLVEDLRRQARNQSFQMMADIINGKIDNPQKMLLYTETEYLLHILDRAEVTSDFLRRIAIKYLVLE